MAGLGPFVLARVRPRSADVVHAQSALLAEGRLRRRAPVPRSPRRRVRRRRQDAEMLRLEAGTTDLMTQADIRPEDLAALRQLRDQGALQLADVGTGVDPNMLWFNLTPGSTVQKAKPYLLRDGVPPGDRLRRRSRRDRQHALPRRRGADLRAGHARQPHLVFRQRAEVSARPRAREGAARRASGSPTGTATACSTTRRGKPVQFSIITQAGNIRERIATMIQEQLPPGRHHGRRRRARSAVDLRPLRRKGTTRASTSASRRARTTRR